jgi:hypothetical protein
MKQVLMSLLAVAAFGATVAGTQTAEAEGWISTNWQPLGTYSHLGDGNNYQGFSASYAVSTPIAPSGVTLSANNTGTIFVPGATNGVCSAGTGGRYCPTTHWAFTLCANNDFITGNIVLGYSVGGTANESFTNTTTAYGSGYWSGFWTSAGTDTGYCPSGLPIVKGGMWMYQY